jgi:hypothetical protein
VKDASGQTVGWFYFRNDPLVTKTAGVLLKDEARRMAVKLREAARAAREDMGFTAETAGGQRAPRRPHVDSPIVQRSAGHNGR